MQRFRNNHVRRPANGGAALSPTNQGDFYAYYRQSAAGSNFALAAFRLSKSSSNKRKSDMTNNPLHDRILAELWKLPLECADDKRLMWKALRQQIPELRELSNQKLDALVSATLRQSRIARVAARVVAGEQIGRWNECFVCGQRLDDPASIERGIGKCCWQEVAEQMEAIATREEEVR
jgi:hypothetical protein